MATFRLVSTSGGTHQCGGMGTEGREVNVVPEGEGPPGLALDEEDEVVL